MSRISIANTKAKAGAVFVAACATFAFGGAFAGSNIGTEPIARGADPLSTLPRHQLASHSVEATRAMQGPRDQYDMETPEGRIPVEELVWHGRMRDTELARSYMSADYGEDDFGYEELDYETYTSAPAPLREPEPEPEPAATSRDTRAGNNPAPQGYSTGDTQQLAAAPSASTATHGEPVDSGNARHIDVTATLANRAR